MQHIEWNQLKPCGMREMKRKKKYPISNKRNEKKCVANRLRKDKEASVLELLFRVCALMILYRNSELNCLCVLNFTKVIH